MSATGVKLKPGHCAVDPRYIKYDSKVKVYGIGEFVAVDTGSAVKKRVTAKRSGKTPYEKSALVVDIFFEHRQEALQFANAQSPFAYIEWSN